MEWLFIAGLSLDISGALLIAWTIYTRTPSEAREEALSRYTANFWVVLFRERERAYVRVGVLLLVAGFVLQIVGYALLLGGEATAVALLLAPAVVALTVLGARSWVDRRPRPRHAETASWPMAIEDERHIHHLATTADVALWRTAYADRIQGRQLQRRSEEARARVNHGRWVFDCPICGSGGIVTPGLPTVACLEMCCAEFGAVLPADREAIEQVLLLRPDPANRNWSDESVVELEAENREHGVPL